MQFHYCTDSNPGTGADDAFVLKQSSLARIDKRTARAAKNTHYCYNQNGPLDHSDVRVCLVDDRSGVCVGRSIGGGVGGYVCGCSGRWARGICFLL